MAMVKHIYSLYKKTLWDFQILSIIDSYLN